MLSKQSIILVVTVVIVIMVAVAVAVAVVNYVAEFVGRTYNLTTYSE
jgi:hypothetical protein